MIFSIFFTSLCLYSLVKSQNDNIYFFTNETSIPSNCPSLTPTLQPLVPMPPHKILPPHVPPQPPGAHKQYVYEKYIVAEDVTSFSRFGHYISASGNIILVGSDLSGIESFVYVFCKPMKTNSDWLIVSKLISPQSSKSVYDGYGLTSVIDGGMILIGAKLDNTLGPASGDVYSYPLIHSETCDFGKLLKPSLASSISPPQLSPKSYFGSSLALHDGIAAVGAPGYSDPYLESGAVFLYKYNPKIKSQWELIKMITGISTSYSNFGSSVSLGEDFLAIGSSGDSSVISYGGAVFIYSLEGIDELNDNSFVDFSYSLSPSTAISHAYFGRNVLFHKDIGLVSAFNEDGSGAVYCFEKLTSNYADSLWVQTCKLTGSIHSHPFDSFGASLAIPYNENNEALIMVGAVGDKVLGSMAGAVFIFKNNGYKWSLIGKLYGNATKAHDNYGCSMAIVNNTVLIGAELADGVKIRTGKVYLEGNIVEYARTIQNDEQDQISESKKGLAKSFSTTKTVVALLAALVPALALTIFVTYRVVKARRILKIQLNPSTPTSSTFWASNPMVKRHSKFSSSSQPFSLMVSDDERSEFGIPTLPDDLPLAQNSTRSNKIEECELPIRISV